MKPGKHNSVGFCHSATHYIASLMDKKDYAGVVKYYEANRSELENIGGSEAAAALRLVAQAHASLTHYPIALRVARVAQHMAAGKSDGVLLAETFLTLGGILRDMGELKEAEKAFRDAESIFRRRDCFEGQSRALNLLAGLFFRRNDYSNALSVLLDAIAITRKLGDSKKLAFMMGNIGRIYTFMGNFGEAKKHLKTNIELSSELFDTTEAARAYLSLGYVYIQEAEYDKAERALSQAYTMIVQSNSRRDEVIYLTYLGELRYRSGQVEDAQKVLEAAMTLAKQIAPNTTLVGRAMRHLAEVYLLLNDHRTAQRLCASSWVIMEKAGDKVETGALCKIKAAIAEAKGQKTEAGKLYARAIDLLAETGVRFEKALALAAAGNSDVYAPRQRMTYLFRAEEFYARHGLDKKRVEIEKLINEIDYPGSDSVSDSASRERSGAAEVDYMTVCPEIKDFKSQLPLIARADLPLLLTGETGVGKDHMARYFHFVARPDAPFVAINCASLPETLLESELFGYKKGAFTGAGDNKRGLFVAANGGVLFLDEIGDMPLTLQTKLLGVLENRRLIPLGSTTEIDLDIKIVAASNRSLQQMVEQGMFRRDLYYRLSGVSFEISPLRRRKEDIPLLLNLSMRRSQLITGDDPVPAGLTRQFVEYDWPGNTRELFNKVKRLEIMAQMVAEGDLVELSRSVFGSETPVTKDSLFKQVEQFERQVILEALLAAHGNKSEAARMLGIHEATVRTKVRRYDIRLESCH